MLFFFCLFHLRFSQAPSRHPSSLSPASCTRSSVDILSQAITREFRPQPDLIITPVHECCVAGIREMIPIAYAHGLETKYDESLAESRISPERAIRL